MTLSILTLLTLYVRNYTILLIALRLPFPVISDLKLQSIHLPWWMENSASKPLFSVLMDWPLTRVIIACCITVNLSPTDNRTHAELQMHHRQARNCNINS